MVKILNETTVEDQAIVTAADKGVANGVATLGADGKLTDGQERVRIHVGATPPLDPQVGDVWIDTA